MDIFEHPDMATQIRKRSGKQHNFSKQNFHQNENDTKKQDIFFVGLIKQLFIRIGICWILNVEWHLFCPRENLKSYLEEELIKK